MFPGYRLFTRSFCTSLSFGERQTFAAYRVIRNQQRYMTLSALHQIPQAHEAPLKRRKLNMDTSKQSESPELGKIMSQKESQAPAPRRIELTETESLLRKLLLDVATYVEESATQSASDNAVGSPDGLANEKLVLRFTGGWVRDKLLGVESHDIDVSINKMTGLQYGLRLKEYLELPGNPEKYGLEGVAKTESQSNKAGTTGKSKVVGGLHKIDANPEKSKHLETVTTRILGLDIDLVNLRKETYTDDSRNPQMEFGTPQEDALRRDATINAMFYNINTSEIEDFTGQGHDDMRSRIIRTPLEPFQTFKDDPLRVLRLIRFASRLDYTLEPSIAQCMGNREIKDALRVKISRERVGVELEKMLRGPDPYMAVTLIDQFDLYRTIFVDPAQEDADSFSPDDDAWRTTLDTLKDILDGDRLVKKTLILDREDQYLSWLLACVVPYRDAPQAQSEPGRKPPPPTAANVVREGIKATNKVSDLVTASIRNRQDIAILVRKMSDQKRRPHQKHEGEDASARDVIGMAIRRWGPTWRLQATFALLADCADEPQSVNSIVRDYDAFVDHVQELGLVDAYSLKPLLDGKTLAKALLTPPGPWMKEALDVVMAWQLRNPGCTSPEEAIEEVKNQARHGELTTDLVNHFLRLTIRPLFAKTKHPAVTAQGRKVTTIVLPKKFDSEESDEIAKPWKGRESSALDLLQWIAQHLDESLVEQNWPLLVPPILSITDDTDPVFKARGCVMLTLFLNHTSSSLLSRTGLDQVFQEALMPCLGYLPTLTPESESIALISNAYPALIALSRSAFPKHPPSGSKTTKEELNAQRIHFLDSLIRKGILAAYAHCSSNVKITQVLLDNLCLMYSELEIESVKHLKYVLPMLSEVLGNPFGASYPPLLLSALKAMQSVILNGWPRMAANRGEVLKGLSLCWLHSSDAHGSTIEEVLREAQLTVQVLKEALQGHNDFEADLASLVAADHRLYGLLQN